MIFNTDNYRDIIKEEFERRSKANINYSLRAYARDIYLSPASLSEIFNKNQGLSLVKAKKIANILKLNQQETNYFLDLVESEHARSKAKKHLAKIRLQKYQKDSFLFLQMDTMKILSDWYHFAILELTYVKGFKSDISWVSKALDISEIEVEMAVKRLGKVGLLEIIDGEWKDKEAYLATPDGTPSKSIRKLHEELLDKAKQAITFQDIEMRDSTASIMAINREKIPKAKKMIKEFRRKLIKEMNHDSKKKDDVYCISIQLFNLTNNKKRGDL